MSSYSWRVANIGKATKTLRKSHVTLPKAARILEKKNLEAIDQGGASGEKREIIAHLMRRAACRHGKQGMRRSGKTVMQP